MSKLLRTALVAVVPLVLVVGSILPQVGASSHREAPYISTDPTADNTDTYAFVSPDRPDTVTLIANYIPFEEPAGGPNFFEFNPMVLYEIHVVNNVDTGATITYQFRFETQIRNDETFLYNTGQIGSISDPNWNRPQFYTVTRIDEHGNAETLGTHLTSPPVNIGPRSTPNYEDRLGAAAVHDLPGGRKVFAGQRDDPFYVDLGSAFDLLGLRPFNPAHRIPLPQAPGVDDLGGYNVHTIALQVPKSDLTRTHMPPTGIDDPAAVVGVWASASRESIGVFSKSGRVAQALPGRMARGSQAAQGSDGLFPWVQVSRLGNPLINEVLIPMSTKDYWNLSDPANDFQFEGFYLKPEPAGLINFLYPSAVQPIDTTGRTDLVLILLQGVPGLNSTGMTQADLLRLNMAVPPTATPNSLGVLAGDLAGFPNGRRLTDDVVDIELRAIAQGYGSFLNRMFGLPNKRPNNQLGDGVNVNDQRFLTRFPYVGTPHEGYEHTHRPVGSTSTPPLD